MRLRFTLRRAGCNGLWVLNSGVSLRRRLLRRIRYAATLPKDTAAALFANTSSILYIALGSLGESVSGHIACQTAGQINPADFEKLDAPAFKLENGFLRLVESLEIKAERGEWIDHLILKESNEVSTPQPSRNPPLQYPIFSCPSPLVLRPLPPSSSSTTIPRHERACFARALCGLAM